MGALLPTLLYTACILSAELQIASDSLEHGLNLICYKPREPTTPA